MTTRRIRFALLAGALALAACGGDDGGDADGASGDDAAEVTSTEPAPADEAADGAVTCPTEDAIAAAAPGAPGKSLSLGTRDFTYEDAIAGVECTYSADDKPVFRLSIYRYADSAGLQAALDAARASTAKAPDPVAGVGDAAEADFDTLRVTHGTVLIFSTIDSSVERFWFGDNMDPDARQAVNVAMLQALLPSIR
jgi:osmoprotectant transport system substrate-binding protein